MKLQPHRIENGPFTGAAIDRTRPLQFRLDGLVVHCFAGDTVLSAVLANGLTTVGTHHGSPVALTARHAPAIVPAALATDPQQALPMERSPANDGADYVTLAQGRTGTALGRLLRRNRHSLGLDLDAADALPRPWLGAQGGAGPQADLVVVGAGVAGMSAALAGAKRGLRVLLVESAPVLGGHARLFGRQDDEDTADQCIARLAESIARADAITVATRAEVFALRPGLVRLHHVTIHNDLPSGRVMDVRARHIVLATGSVERLPIFSGNRLPGIDTAGAAFELAHHYGVWPGRAALFATGSSAAYRLAMLAHDAGIAVQRILDARTQPQSRFIEFSKAYGMRLAAGTFIASAAPGPHHHGLLVKTQLALDGIPHDDEATLVDRLILCGGWQPDLSLWHMAGGESLWNATAARLEPTTPPPGVALAGSAAGWLTRQACIDSGTDAVNLLLDRQRNPVQDRLIDPLYETPDGPITIGTPPDDESHPAYLDGGMRYLARPRAAPVRRRGWLPFRHKPAIWSLADSSEPLDIVGVAAGVRLGAIPAASAGIVAQERVAMIGIDTRETAPASVPAAPLPPPYLAGRYRDASLFLVAAADQRRLEVGALVQPDADETDPLKAIGVIVRSSDKGAIALVAGTTGLGVSIRASGQSVAARLIAPWREDLDLGAALGGGTGTP